jgi:hypothetical protein
MKKNLFGFALLVIFFIPEVLFSADKTVVVEVLYMNHGPLQNTLAQMRQIFSKYGSRITVTWHDYETSDGERFMASKGIHQHVPLTIWIDGQSAVIVKGKEIKFTGFPTGSGPASFQGQWTMEYLRIALDQITGIKK